MANMSSDHSRERRSTAARSSNEKNGCFMTTNTAFRIVQINNAKPFFVSCSSIRSADASDSRASRKKSENLAAVTSSCASNSCSAWSSMCVVVRLCRFRSVVCDNRLAPLDTRQHAFAVEDDKNAPALSASLRHARCFPANNRRVFE